MAFIGEIGARLSADNTDFKAKMHDAGEAAERLDKQVKKFGLGFGGVAAIATAFRAIVDHARDLEGPLDANLARAKRFAEGLDEAKKGMLDVGTQALGVVNGLGEWIGRQVAIVRHGREQVELSEKIEQQTQETLAAIDEARKVHQEVNRIREATAAIERKTTEEATKQLDLKTQIALQETKLRAAQDELARLDGDAIAIAKAELAIAQERAALEKLYADDKKKTREEAKRAADAEAKAAAEAAAEAEKHAQKMAQLDEEELDRMIEQARLADEAAEARRAAEAQELADLEKQFALLNQIGLSREQLIATLRQQGIAEDAILKKLEQQNEAMRVGFRIRGAYDDQVNDRVLEDKIRTLSRSLEERLRAFRESGRTGSFSESGFDPLIGHERAELERARAELAARERARQLVGRFGEGGASRFYEGNMPEFERLLRFVQDQPDAKRTADLLTEINQRLQNSGLFPRR